MKKNKLYSLLALLMIASMILAACEGATDDASSGDDSGSSEEATEAEHDDGDDHSEEAAAFEGTSVAAASCDYGGKISSITAVDEFTVQFDLCKSDPAFLAKIAFTPFGIQPSEWIAETGGTGELLEKPIGTGPYMVAEWDRGNQVVFSRFDGYWGEAGAAETVTLRWLTEGAARLQELQAGTADFITNVAPDDYAVIEADPDLVLIPQDNPNILYLAMTNTFAPFDDVRVRQAVAMGIDRERIVENFYTTGSTVPSHFTPCSIPGGCEGEDWYAFDAEAARALLADAGFPDGFETAIYYRDVFRAYLPEPPLVAQELQAQLEANLGITAEIIPMESGEFIAASTDGQLDGFYLLGWGADYPHVTNFLDFHFGSGNPQFGETHPEIYEPLEVASTISDPAEAAALYEEANNAIRELVPMVPLANGGVAHAALASLDGAYYPPFGANEFYRMTPTNDDSDYVDMVYVQNAEPISLYCADETDGESLRPCQQVVETLLDYATDSGDTVPELATSCTGNDDSTVWVCELREGVTFHDGSSFDANDVVASWAAGIDASSPYHVGNTGGFDYFAYLWDGLINAE